MAKVQNVHTPPARRRSPLSAERAEQILVPYEHDWEYGTGNIDLTNALTDVRFWSVDAAYRALIEGELHPDDVPRFIAVMDRVFANLWKLQRYIDFSLPQKPTVADIQGIVDRLRADAEQRLRLAESVAEWGERVRKALPTPRF